MTGQGVISIDCSQGELKVVACVARRLQAHTCQGGRLVADLNSVELILVCVGLGQLAP
jgi:hypothetical protein